MNSNILQYPIKSGNIVNYFLGAKHVSHLMSYLKVPVLMQDSFFFQTNRVYNFFSPELTLVKWYLNPRTVV